MLCVDVDNVLAQTDKVFRALIRTATNGLVCLEYEDVKRFNYYECKDARGNGISKEQWPSIHDTFSTSGIIQTVEPVGDAVRALAELSRDMQICIVTSRLPQAKEATERWLREHEVPFDELRFVGHRQKHFGAEVFFAAVEDDYDQALAFSEKRVPCVLIRHPWNHERDPWPHVEWVDDWGQCVAMIRALLPK